jgi:hypothetical protein
MIAMKGVPPAEAQSRAKAVLLPLVPRICADPVLRGALSDDLVRLLGQKAVRLSLEGNVALKGRITREELAALLDVSVQSGNIDTIGAAYVDSPFLDENSTYIALLKVIPKLKVLPWTEEGWKATIEELHSRQKTHPAALGDLFNRDRSWATVTQPWRPHWGRVK